MAAFSFSLCADDYAMTPGVSRGILEALAAGALSGTSVMTTAPHWPDSANALRAYIGRADIGLHLNLTLGAPLGAMPSLAPRGVLPSIGVMMRCSRTRAFPNAEIAAEIDRQLDRFVAIFGRPPDHVDGHQHVHMLAPIRPILFRALATRGWTPTLRDSTDHALRILGRRTCVTKAIGLRVLGQGFAAQAAAFGLPTNDGFAGFSAFDQSQAYADLFTRYLTYPGRRHLVMCHPGYVDDELRALDPVVETREQELAFLTSNDFGAVLERAESTLVRQAS